MKIALTGATGQVGRFLLRGLTGQITTLGRTPVAGYPHIPWDLGGAAPDLRGFDALVHAAFSHVPGKYRGGEGDDPEGFLRLNLDGSKRLFDAAAQATVPRVIFLSSRAVFDGYPDDTPLTEDLPPRAKSLYGQAKITAETHLFSLPLTGIALRATGVYGPGVGHKWEALFADFLSGVKIPTRRGTEVHGDDLAAACQLLLSGGETGAAHASDLVIDRRDLLNEVIYLSVTPHAIPEESDRPINPLICTRLQALGWQPGGWEKLRRDLPQLLATVEPR
ncbi:MAG: NAD(P)-dependent oxidoreductase [Pelagimonas sp.]|jgi:nucleoside-diphosphate-sugar epimerase|nr:NAD(P)-dependent oxidoreductase [Pelagimonas sp.]